MNTVSDQPLYAEAPEWSGRSDGPGAEHARWHCVVTPYAPGAEGQPTKSGAVLLGFASDEGVERNHGRQGAAQGPAALRAALGSLALHDDYPRYDAGTITTQGDDLEGAHQELSNAVKEIIDDGHLAIILGGGHETAFGSHRGAYQAHNAPLNIINLDAHFDLRQADRPTSGTPFKQIADMVNADSPHSFRYSVLGISKPNNTKVLFDTAEELGTTIHLDEELVDLTPSECAKLAHDIAAQDQPVHLSIDLDVLPADIAPGVSAPAALGVSYDRIRAMAIAIAATGKLTLVDIVELNPEFDIDSRTAKAAARLINDIIIAHAEATIS